MDSITTDILVVGGGAGGTAAAIQAARRGLKNNKSQAPKKALSVVLVSDLPWLGGMLTSAGVAAPDGNELEAFQTGIWGDFLKELSRRHPEGLNQGWVSFFTYNPAVGASVFADWVAELPNLKWISNERPQEVLRQGNRITGVRFNTVTVNATITLDGTELGDVLALGDVPHRWGWETRNVWNEPSAPVSLGDPTDSLYEITQQYPIQSPTWVVLMQDFGESKAPKIESKAPKIDIPAAESTASKFTGAWANYGDDEMSAGETCLNYGRLPGNLLMINWPHKGNDYGIGLHRLIGSDKARAEYGQEAQQHSLAFAHYIQTQLGDRYGLATDVFPQTDQSPGGGLALMPYYRESRRLIGMTTVSERDILPVSPVETVEPASLVETVEPVETDAQQTAQAAALPMTEEGHMDAIAFGNYANDHHYPGFEMPLAPKSIRWGGRWTGTPFTIPYRALVPKTVDGLLVCEKNISVSHIANGATRLQPVVLGIGQAAGMAAALCIEKQCEPRDLLKAKDIRNLQTALLTETTAPAAIVPLFNLPTTHSQWLTIQEFYLSRPQQYPLSGHHPFSHSTNIRKTNENSQAISIKGMFRRDEAGGYQLHQNTAKTLPKSICLVTVISGITETLSILENDQSVHVLGTWNSAGEWLLCTDLKAV
ncbi:MAG: FAD-dependent oxidoreductase [Cyanobacteria bacterium J06629_19]